jgi:hypothetical protein
MSNAAGNAMTMIVPIAVKSFPMREFWMLDYERGWTSAVDYVGYRLTRLYPYHHHRRYSYHTPSLFTRSVTRLFGQTLPPTDVIYSRTDLLRHWKQTKCEYKILGMTSVLISFSISLALLISYGYRREQPIHICRARSDA